MREPVWRGASLAEALAQAEVVGHGSDRTQGVCMRSSSVFRCSLVLVAVSLLTAAPAPAQSEGAVRGQVVAQANRRSLTQTTVTLTSIASGTSRQSFTDPDG